MTYRAAESFRHRFERSEEKCSELTPRRILHPCHMAPRNAYGFQTFDGFERDNLDYGPDLGNVDEHRSTPYLPQSYPWDICRKIKQSIRATIQTQRHEYLSQTMCCDLRLY